MDKFLLQDEIFIDEDIESKSKSSVECLGKEFVNEEARREYYTNILREKLMDPEFRKIEGFPLGEDEDILALSDPPYYTACPNPFLSEFIQHYQKYENGSSVSYSRQPLAIDVKQTRDTIIYSAHTYHTKVPPQAVAHYIEYFTEPGDLILDAFSGSGMTGVACKLFKEGEERCVILCDLSPAATFISATYMDPPDPKDFEKSSLMLLNDAQKEMDPFWTIDLDEGKSEIEFEVWTELFTCPNCQRNVESMEVVSATEEIGAAKAFKCPHCGTLVSKAPTKKSGAIRLERHLQTRYDVGLNKIIQYLPRIPMIIQVTDKRIGRRKVKTPLDHREKLLCMDYSSAYWFPVDKLIEGERYCDKDYLPSYGITHIHHFYLPRQLKSFSLLWHIAKSQTDKKLRRALFFFLTSNALGFTILNRFGPTHYSQVNKYFSGTLYVPSTIAEASPHYVYRNKQKRLVKAFSELTKNRSHKHIITTQSSTNIKFIPDNSI
ncbi:MAG: DNA methyltransferase, partial [Syntrophomonas sp.]